MIKPPVRAIALLIAFGLTSCAQPQDEPALKTALASKDPAITKVMGSPEQYEVQIMYSAIERKGDSVVFSDESFQLDPDTYFYPASTVKFPIAFLALEKIGNMDNLTSTSRFFVEGDSLETTIRDEVNKIFAVSDNDAYNRLFEFLGTDHINARLGEMNAGPLRIAHRLSVEDADDPKTRPLIFYLNDTTLTELPGSINRPVSSIALEKLLKGKGYYDGDSLMEQPMDFSKKNYLPVESLHNLMKRVIFPGNFPERETFNLDADDRKFALERMAALPYTSGYDRSEYYDSYVKFFMYGDRKEPMPEHIRIYNKVGYAYGYLTDCAYIKDTKNNVEFLLTATIHVNEDGIYNDNVYEYDETGIPFLAALGRSIYDHELQHQ
ncbi:serine hydrolase [Robertkochia sediminum]|uniref:serine hydrolase n=1 Tax=Robertkochia sediminum TaxID=2785326 RepID=UPI00193388F0|nr:serine hydrolase [Robertkochia sediminum]MBL7472675.1 serine hydrolase [Robertkochia sediminum]